MLLCVPLQARTFVGEDVRESQVWTLSKSPYIVALDVHVWANSELRIEAGVKVLFSSQARLTVEGVLIAEGSAQKPIRFEGLKGMEWQGFVFQKNTTNQPDDRIIFSDTARNRFSHCIFQGANNSPLVLFEVLGRDVFLQNCQILDCQTGIQTDKQGDCTIDSSLFKRCYRPIHTRTTARCSLLNSQILDYSLVVLGGTAFFKKNVFSNTKISLQTNQTGVLIWLTGAGVVNILDNTFKQSVGAALTVYKTTRKSAIFVRNNLFEDNHTHLALSCGQTTRCKLLVQHNHFYTPNINQIALFDSCGARLDTIRLDTNYSEMADLEAFVKYTEISQPANSSQTKLEIKALLPRRRQD
jgi:hypothetical protein